MVMAPKIHTITAINTIKLIISKIDNYSPPNGFIMSLKIFIIYDKLYLITFTKIKINYAHN